MITSRTGTHSRLQGRGLEEKEAAYAREVASKLIYLSYLLVTS